MNIRYRVDLSDEEHAQLTAMLNGGKCRCSRQDSARDEQTSGRQGHRNPPDNSIKRDKWYYRA